MGVGASVLIKLVELTEQSGVDGYEPVSTEIANFYAEIDYVKQNRGYADNKASFRTTYIFYTRYDERYTPTVSRMLEFNNKTYSIQSIERGKKVKNLNKIGFQWLSQYNGRYWRIEATSEDYG
jgi:hypothetical protein